VIDLLTEDLKRDEGFVSHAYQDSEGYWTIGYGRLIDERLRGGIGDDEAEYLLENDIRQSMTDLDYALTWWRALPEPSQRGLVNMCFNLGLPRLLSFKKMLAALEAGDRGKAAMECLDSKWSRQVGERLRRIAALYRND
jgi:lysozyme